MIIRKLEKVASTLESKGLVKEAAQIDSICNSIEKLALDIPGQPSEIGEELKQSVLRNSEKADYTESSGRDNQGRFFTRVEPPAHLKELFDEKDGIWYLVDIEKSDIVEKPNNVFVIHKITKDKGTEVPGLTVV